MWFLINQRIVRWAKSTTKRLLCWASYWSKPLLKCAKCRGIIEQFIGLHAHSQAPCDGKLFSAKVHEGFFNCFLISLSPLLSKVGLTKKQWRGLFSVLLVQAGGKHRQSCVPPRGCWEEVGKAEQRRRNGALRKKKVVGIGCCSVSWGEFTMWVASGFACVPVKIIKSDEALRD